VAGVVGDYVLGTHDAELVRLGLQHRVWRESVLGAWRRAGLRVGWRVVDVGAGPGYATWDLAEAVGPSGGVLAVERSDRFVAALREESRRQGLEQVAVLELDVMQGLGPTGFDMTWCRWVASFVSSVPRLAAWIHHALRPGGVAVFHEYVDYGSWRFSPPRPKLREFVGAVMASWRATGGEPDVAPTLIGALRRVGFGVHAVRPLVFATRPGELTWQWPVGFVETNMARLQQLGRVSKEWADEVLQELEEAERDPTTVMVTPMVLEIVASRE
jgi:SAM-dependent methyltransferase